MDDIIHRERLLLENVLGDESAEPIVLPSSLLRAITRDFSQDMEIGRGGFGAVYKGELSNGRTVAVKKLLEGNTNKIQDKDFDNEVLCLRRVKHKNIVRFLGYCSEPRMQLASYEGKHVWAADELRRFLCFEYLPKGNLDDYLKDASSPHEWSKRYQILKGICEGLSYLHERHIVHRDLKPQNILLDDNLVPKIADFGLSRLLCDKKSEVITESSVGSIGYSSPEFLRGVITLKNDIYSLGHIILDLLMRDNAYSNVEEVVEIWKNLSGISESDASLKQVRVLADIGFECMDPDPSKRPETCDVIDRLVETEILVRSNESTSSAGQAIVVVQTNSIVAQTNSFGAYGLIRRLEATQILKSVTMDIGTSLLRQGPKKGSLIKGSAVLISRKLHMEEVFGSITCQLISATFTDRHNRGRGIVGSAANLEHRMRMPALRQDESKLVVNFEWEVEKHGVPGAIIVKNNRSSKFFLKTITLEDVPDRGTMVFAANSWVYPAGKYRYNRVFFANDPYLPSQMPEPLRAYRADELRWLRGQDMEGPYQEHDRVYRYDVYNDLGEGNTHPVLGGSPEHPYPRRCRTGRSKSKKDEMYESRVPLRDQVYVPSDESLGREGIIPAIRSYISVTPGEWDSFKGIMNLYNGGINRHNIPGQNVLRRTVPLTIAKELRTAGSNYLHKFPKPEIVEENEHAWMSDEEFARQIVAGVNPMIIRRLMEFPPKSSLDAIKFGDQTSAITTAHIERYLEGLTVEEALKDKRLYILDHHDHFMPFLREINEQDGVFVYATRTILFLRGDDTLKLLAIELSLPLAKSEVYTPAYNIGTEGWVWQLAKAYAAVNDTVWHQLISHWLHTHAVMEPFVIATNRWLSVAHPLYKLLQPHFRDTLAINALARQTLVNAGGILEQTLFPGKCALAMSSQVYRHWKFTEQGLPDDLIKRGVAVEDPSSPSKVRLLIKDYPYATDGLLVWQAIEEWVADYCAIYYADDDALQGDLEVQEWWMEVREVGHGDLREARWWPKMHTVAELAKACATIIWIASALHAAVGCAQYSYAGFPPNRPIVSRRPMPAQLEEDPEKFFCRTITGQFEAILGISSLQVQSKLSPDEVFLGHRDTRDCFSDPRAVEAFHRFRDKLVEVQKEVSAMNKDSALRNRIGTARFPYSLLSPSTSDGKASLTGIPNSISI